MANAIVSQSGGPTGVINASLVGVIEQACRQKEIDKLYGAVHAVSGIVKEHFIDLKQLTAETLGGWPVPRRRHWAPAGTNPTRPTAKRFWRYSKRDIRYFYYIGAMIKTTCYIINHGRGSRYDPKPFTSQNH